jgi:hypothetical protein
MERATQLPLSGVGRHRIAAAALALLILAPWPRDLHAQAFIASHPHPEFGIGPLFVSVSVGKDDVRPAHRPLAVTVSWSLVPPPNRRAADIAQDLYLLWPGEVAGTVGTDGADLALLRHVRALGFQVREHGRLRLSARARSQMGTRAEVRTLGEAPFVTFVSDGGSTRPASGATYIRIPWAPESASLDWLVRLELPVRDVIVPKPVTWIEDMFWGRWYAIMLGFGDLGSVSLYPLYFGVRDRIIPLARDFSMLIVEFANARQLRVDDIVPPSASRQVPEGRDDWEVISLALAASQGLVPQLVKVHFTYARQRLPARPLLISAFLVVLGGIMRWLFTPVMAWIGRTLRAHVLLSRAPDAGRYRGMTPPPQILDRIRPGETTYEDVLRLCGPGAEEQTRLPASETQALVYREQREVPRRGWSLGWFAIVRYWHVEDREVEITFERGRVRDIQTRIRRSRRRDPLPA